MPTNWSEGYHAQLGMTLRDWFAGQALAGLSNDYTENNPHADEAAILAKNSYRIADAMLVQREARK